MGSGSSKKASSAPAPKPNEKVVEKKTEKKTVKKTEKSEPVPKPVAFEIKFEEKNEDSIIHKHPPKRLQRLEQATDGPKLTAKMLEQKLRIAEENRQRELDKVRNITSASKIRRQLQDAQGQDKKEDILQGIEERQRSAGKIRNNKLKEVENKKQEAAIKAQKAKEKVNRLKQGADDVEIEKDKYYNDYDDEWNLTSARNNLKTGAAEHLSTSSNNRTSQASQGGSTKKKSKRGSISEDDDDFFR